MPKLIIDNMHLEVERGSTILDAAGKVGIEIPTMCFLKGCEPSTSCMLCVVKLEGRARLLPACGTIAEEGMHIETDSEEVRAARRMAMDLLLSEHLGDCMGPCQVTCPAQMNIPLMIRQIAAGRLNDAIATVKKDIALPAVLGRICPAPCEKSCRRAVYDAAVSICLLKRYAADADLQSSRPHVPYCMPRQGKRAAIVGAGPAGLAAAYYLMQQGYGCTVFDEHDKPGGMLRYGVSREALGLDVLEAEIATIEKLGPEFRPNTRVGRDVSMEELRKDFDAVFVAIGELEAGREQWLGLKMGENGIKTDGNTYQTSEAGVFAGGDAVRRRRLTVRAVADGKEAAVAIGQYLSGAAVTGPVKLFNSRIGKLKDGEIERFLGGASRQTRVTPSQENGGFARQEAVMEAARCLHCDCRKPQACKLRQYAQEFSARAARYKDDRRTFEQSMQHPDVVFEPGKCIDCGLCVQITSRQKEKLGLTFVGRGFDVRVAVPFNRSVAEGLRCTAKQCVEACPTGALAFKEDAPGH